MLDYSLYTSFFPDMKISWDLFGRRNTNTVQSNANIAGYDVNSTSYGGTLNLRLNSKSGSANNNNNNYGSRNSIILPDIMLSRIHTESESLSTLSPLHETRDDTRASINYRLNSSFDLTLDGGIENYENLINNSSYDSKTANLTSNIALSPDADLRLNGRMSDRDTTNLAGFETSDKIWAYGALLDFKEKNRLHHFYRYDYSKQDATGSSYITQRAQAQIAYKIIEDLQVRTGLDYSLAEYERTTAPQEKSQLETGSVLAGASYRKKYTPQFLGPFVFNTNYDFTMGFSSLSSEVGGPQGNGRYYTNNVDLGLGNSGKYETLFLNYAFNNKRDDSPVHNDTWRHSYRFNFSTSRLPMTAIRAVSAYTVQENRSDAGTIFFQSQPGVNQESRQFTYDISADFIPTDYLNFQAGISRGQATSATYTLSTLAPPPSSVVTLDNVAWVQANFRYIITRNLLYRATAREEKRRSLSADSKDYQVNMNLDYRIRQVFVNLEYRWREDIPENMQKSEQQYYYVKVTRPF